MSKVYRLRNWSTCGGANANPYAAPEQLSLHLQGEVYGNPNFPDGDHIITSAVDSSERRLVTTRSGSKYLLDGDPDPMFAQAMEDSGYVLDLNDPIKIRQPSATDR